MYRFKKISLLFLIMVCLAACNQKGLINDQNHPLSKAEKVMNKDYRLKDAKLTGFWISASSYVRISRSPDGKLLMRKFYKDKERDILGSFTGRFISDYVYIGKFASGKFGEDSSLLLELNETKDQLTITLPNEKPVTYKATEMTPEDYQSTGDKRQE